LAGLFLALTLTLSARAGGDRDHDRDDQGGGVGGQQPSPLKLLGTILIPGSPIASTDIAYVDQASEILVFADRSNKGVDVLDAENDVFLGRVLGFTGASSSTVTSTHQGPNGAVITRDKKLWAGDGDTTVKVADLDPTSPTYLKIIVSISTASVPSFTTISNCTGGLTGTCNRDDEMAYDSADNIVVVATDEPNSIQPYLTFIDANPPYTILGQINFVAQGAVASGGLEQPVWDPGLHRILQTIPVTNGAGTGSIAVINPVTEKVERVISLSAYNCSPSGEDLGPNQHLVVACKVPGANAPSSSSFPLVIDVSTGNEIGPGINQVGGGDEVYYNPGDNRFLVSSTVDGVTTASGTTTPVGDPAVLGVINADNGDWLQNVPPATAGTPGTGGLTNSGKAAGNLAAFGEDNHVFVIVKPQAPATTVCTPVAVAGTGGTTTLTDYGCVAVFGPTREAPDSFHF